MAEIWGAAIMVGGAVISGMGAKKEKEADRKAQKGMTKDEAKYSAILSQFDNEQQYYYQQLDKQEKMRGLDEFKKFSGMSRIDPNYVNTNTGPILPEKPDANKLFPDPPKSPKKKKKKSGLGGLIDKIDPLGSKLIEIDPISDAVING